MRVALVYPPATDPTAPYLAVPMLTGFLRANGVTVTPIDANIEAFDALLRPEALLAIRDRIEARIAELEARPSLDHEDQLAYAQLWRARGDAHAAPEGIERAVQILRDRDQFFDKYGSAVATVEAALRAISAAYAPLHMDFTAYRTPFALTTADETLRECAPDRDPFDAYIRSLAARLQGEDVIGISVAFPGQLQPAYAFGKKLKELCPRAHVTVGGPAITQMLIRLKGSALARGLGPFDSAIVFEGERPLLALVQALQKKESLRALTNVVIRDPLQGARYLSGHEMEDMKALPAPDFEGMPLHLYLSPELTLPYDPTRGCYWGKCTFCHYGLAEVGTATYRERAVPQMIEHLRALAEKHGTRRFYFSQDSVAPKTLLKLAEGLLDAKLDLRWATDLKPEKYLTKERAETLRKAGAVACALGVESASPRVLELIDKGAPITVVRDVVGHLASAGVAAEAMCFSDFPTETRDEALQTLRWLDDLRSEVALFILGEFDLTHGALIAQEPSKFGLREVWQLEGDEMGTGLFYDEETPAKSPEDRALVEGELAKVSSRWRLRRYPWAGAISTAHTVLFYDRFGAQAFQSPRPERAMVYGYRVMEGTARFDLHRAMETEQREEAIWQTLAFEEKKISRDAYRSLARATPPLAPSPMRWRYAAGETPRSHGKRPVTRPNALPRAR